MTKKIIFTILIVICILGLTTLFKEVYSFILLQEKKEVAQGLEKAEEIPEFEKEKENEEWQEILPVKTELIEDEPKEALSETIGTTKDEAEINDFETDEIEIKEFKTDKENYGSYEKIQFSVKISSKKDIENVEIKITGIQPYQRPYINKSKITNLAAGENIFYIEAETPYCTSGCGGVYPGPYAVHASIFIDGELIVSAENSINLVAR